MARPFARAFTGAEAAEIATDEAEKCSRVPGIEPLRVMLARL